MCALEGGRSGAGKMLSGVAKRPLVLYCGSPVVCAIELLCGITSRAAASEVEGSVGTSVVMMIALGRARRRLLGRSWWELEVGDVGIFHSLTKSQGKAPRDDCNA